MESPSSTVRRRAWISCSRRWPTLEALDPERPPGSLPSASITDDDVFSDGSFTGKIEDWLQGCGSESTQLSFESMVKANNCDDDLSLGADASLLSGGRIPPEARSDPLLQSSPRPQQGRVTRRGLRLPSFHMGHSTASSCPSSSTWKTTSSVSEVLNMYSEDAEETLYELGFGNDEPQATVRIPPRFFTFPSEAKGITFRLFLDSQLRRIREEDPSLSLASRFRQVQVLTAMANAFYSLYSHVSRTPLQKLVPPELSFSSPMEKIDRFRSSVRSEPRSPVERLKDTVSKMCLYTGSPRGSDSTSPQPSPRKRSSLPDVVDMVLVKVKGTASKKLDLEECNGSGSAVDVGLVLVGHQTHHREMTSREHTDNIDAGETVVQPAGDDRETQDVKTSPALLSGEPEVSAEGRRLSPQAERDSGFTQSDTDEIKPVAMVTYDLICPHQAPFGRQHTRCPKTNTGTEGTDTPHGPDVPISNPGEDSSYTGDIISSGAVGLPVLAPNGSHTHHCITVSGWEGDAPSCCPSNAPDSCRASNVPPVQTREGPLNGGKSRFLNPPALQSLRNCSADAKRVHSFELEEVHSAGEEEFGRSNNTTTTNWPLCTKGEVARGDSVQSDSSGYADEESSPSSDRHAR